MGLLGFGDTQVGDVFPNLYIDEVLGSSMSQSRGRGFTDPGIFWGKALFGAHAIQHLQHLIRPGFTWGVKIYSYIYILL